VKGLCTAPVTFSRSAFSLFLAIFSSPSGGDSPCFQQRHRPPFFFLRSFPYRLFDTPFQNTLRREASFETTVFFKAPISALFFLPPASPIVLGVFTVTLLPSARPLSGFPPFWQVCSGVKPFSSRQAVFFPVPWSFLSTHARPAR